jgi:ADP-ribosyl-[dinitrogen reductase] hydrolase
MIDLHTRDRALGALLGLATGDALGTTLEFSARDSLPPLTDIVGGGPFQLEAGVWTDDTSMALALAESLAQRGSLDPGDLMRRFVNWWHWGVYSATGECFDIGTATRQALARFEADGNPIAGSTDPFSAGNGSLMRLAPVAIWGVKHGEQAMRDAARLQSATTHGAQACLDACEGYALILRAAILGADFETAIKAAEGIGGDPIAPFSPEDGAARIGPRSGPQAMSPIVWRRPCGASTRPEATAMPCCWPPIWATMPTPRPPSPANWPERFTA